MMEHNTVAFLFIIPQDLTESLFSTGLFRRLKNEIDSCLIEVLTQDTHKWMFEKHPYVDVVHSYPRNKRVHADSIHEIPYDYIVDLENNWSSWRLVNKLGVVCFAIERGKSLFARMLDTNNTAKTPYHEQLKTLAIFDINTDAYFPELHFDWKKNQNQKTTYTLLSVDTLLEETKTEHGNVRNYIETTKHPLIIAGSESLIAQIVPNKNEMVQTVIIEKTPAPEFATIVREAGHVIASDNWILALALGFKKNISCLQQSQSVLWDNTQYPKEQLQFITLNDLHKAVVSENQAPIAN
ncbi:MAG: hypothetical protein RIS47_1843 [Bacteroidota bacterium]|jgi:hypothetical protein